MKSFNEVRDIYLDMFPKEINIYVNKTKGVCKEKLEYYYHFSFSNIGMKRHLSMKKSDIKNTEVLFLEIINEFFKSALLNIKEKNQGIMLESVKGDKLNIYFNEDTRESINNFYRYLENRQRLDSKNYINYLIDNSLVEEIKVYGTNHSGVSYSVTNSFEYKWKKEKRINICCKVEEKFYKVKEEDFKLVKDIVFNFINKNINEDISYKYENNGDYYNDKLIIRCNNKVIKIASYEVIDRLEKEGLIDYINSLKYTRKKERDGYNNK